MRALLLFGVALALAGCTTTETLSRAEPGGLARLARQTRGKTATVHLVTGEASRGRVEFVRPDSTAWRPREGRRVVPTESVFMVVRDPRGRNALLGAGIGLAVGTVVLAAGARQARDGLGSGNLNDTFTGISTMLLVPVLPVQGLAIGAFAQPRQTWFLSDPPPSAPTAPAP